MAAPNPKTSRNRMTLADSVETARRYGVAIVLVVVALGVRLALDPILGPRAPLLVFLLAVLASSRFSGRGPGLAATALSILAVWYFFTDPRYSFAIANPSDIANLALMAASGIAICLLAEPFPPSVSALLTASETAQPFLRRAGLLGGALVSLVVLTGLLYKDFERERDDQSWVANTYQVIDEARGLMSRLGEAESAGRGYQLTGDSRYLDSRHAAEKAADSSLRSLRQLTADNPSQGVRLAALARLVAARFAALEEVARVRNAKGLEAAVDALQTGNGSKLMAAVSAAIEALDAEERALLAKRTAVALDQSLRTRWLLGLGSGCLLMLLVVAGVVIERDIRERDRSRRALRQSEERLRLALDAAQAGTWEWDLRTNENSWSEEVWRLYGLAPHSRQPSYDAWREVIHPDDRARAERMVAESAARGGELSVEFRVGNGNGSPRWLLARGRPLCDAKGRTESFIGIVLDLTERKQAEEALRERERNLRRFAEAAPVAIAMFDNEMRYLACSERFRQDFRLDAEVAGRSHYEIFPEIPERWREIHRRCLAGAVERSDGESFVRADGSEQWIRWEIQPWRRADGEIGGIVLFSEEITAQRQSEQALRDSEAQFRTLANAIPQLCWMADEDGWIFWYNQRWYEYTGATPEQMAGWGWQSVHDPKVLPQVLERWKASIAAADPFEMVFPLRGADGVFHPFLTRVVPVRDEAGELVRWFGTNTDITAQQNAEAALRQISEQQRLAMEAAELGAWDYRFASGDVWWDEHCRNMFGFRTGDRVVYAEAIARIHPEDGPATDAAVRRALAGAGGGAYHREFRVVWPDGSIHWVASHGRVHFDTENGTPVHFIGVNMDVTERKRAETEILQLNTQLERRVQTRTAELEAINKELETFAYSVSHDLRAPLRGIDGWSLALLEDYGGQLDSRARQYLARVRSETQRMGVLIDDLLQLSRITRTEMQRAGVDLSALAHALAARLREEHAGRRIVISIDAGLTVDADPHLLEIALTNLFGNAVKFTGPRPEARIEFGRMNGGGAFYVRDNGVGFDMTYAQALFGAFQRLHKTSEFPGTGIGLATVQRIIHRHGGRVWAEAQPDRGATFYFTLGNQ